MNGTSQLAIEVEFYGATQHDPQKDNAGIQKYFSLTLDYQSKQNHILYRNLF